MSELSHRHPVPAPDAAPNDPVQLDHGEHHGPTPTGTFGVIGLLVLSISTLWLLVLGILEGRA